MAQIIKDIIADTQFATVSTANSNLDGTGTMVTVVTGADSGNSISHIVIKATGNTVQGIVRLFVEDASSNKRLLREVVIPPVTASATLPTFSKTVVFKPSFELKSGWKINASTSVAQSLNIIALGFKWTYGVTETYQKVTAIGAMGLLSTANSNRDGTGTLITLLTGTNKGNVISKIVIKALATTTEGMIRFYIEDNQGTPVIKLFREVRVPAITRTDVIQSFSTVIDFEGGFLLKAGYKLKASTEKAESFQVIVENVEWQYAS